MSHHVIRDEEIAMLRSELEILMRERQSLLRIAAAAADFIQEFDIKTLPAENYDEAEHLAEAINGLNEETLKDALEIRRAEKIVA